MSYAVACGLPLMTAVSVYSVEGLAGLGGRVVLGITGDGYGAKRVLIAAIAFVFPTPLRENALDEKQLSGAL